MLAISIIVFTSEVLYQNMYKHKKYPIPNKNVRVLDE